MSSVPWMTSVDSSATLLSGSLQLVAKWNGRTMHSFRLVVKRRRPGAILAVDSIPGETSQLRRGDRPAQSPTTRLGLAVELEQTGGTLFQLDAGVFDVRHQPGCQDSQVRLVSDGGHDVHVAVALEPLDEFTHRRVRDECLRCLDASGLERIGDQLRRLSRAHERARGEEIDRIDRALNSLRVQRHLPTTFVGERTLVVAVSRARPDLFVFGDPVADNE